MKTRELTKTAVLATILYVVYFMGSWFLYIELVNFVILLYGFYLSRKQAWLSVFLFTMLVILTKGLGLWSIMYVVVFPQYALIYSFMKNRVQSEYIFAGVGFLLAFLAGTLIDLPFMLMNGEFGKAFVIRLLMGFQVSLGNGVCTFLACLYFFKKMGRVFARI